MGSMIFWRLIIFSWQKDGKFSYMLILCLGSFLSIAHFNVYISHVTYGACFIRMVPFFSMGVYQRNKLSFSREWVWEPTVYHFSPSWNWEIILFLSNNYKPILSVGKGKNLRNAILANSHKYNCHDMNWNDMDRGYCCSWMSMGPPFFISKCTFP